MRRVKDLDLVLFHGLVCCLSFIIVLDVFSEEFPVDILCITYAPGDGSAKAMQYLQEE